MSSQESGEDVVNYRVVCHEKQLLRPDCEERFSEQNVPNSKKQVVNSKKLAVRGEV